MLIKTEKARQELRPGNRGLGQRERAVLLLADGPGAETMVASMFDGEGKSVLNSLLAQGYLERSGVQGKGTSLKPGRTGEGTAMPARRHQSDPEPHQIRLPAGTTRDGASPQAHGDQFASARSMASARMFLFDMSERLFAPRDASLATHYREALRNARDPANMLLVSRAMLKDIEKLAGPERADGISERLAKMLPPELLGGALS